MDIEKKLRQLNPYIPGLNKRIAYYLQSLEREDYDGILLLTYPGLFRFVPKALLREKIAETFHDDEMDFSMDVFEVDAIGKLIEADEGSYVKVDYTLLMSLHLHDDMAKSPVELEEKKAFFLRSFEIAYGKRNIWYESTTKCYCFHKHSSMVAIRDKHSPEWTFLTWQPGPMMEEFLPKSVCLILEAGMEQE